MGWRYVALFIVPFIACGKVRQDPAGGGPVDAALQDAGNSDSAVPDASGTAATGGAGGGAGGTAGGDGGASPNGGSGGTLPCSSTNPCPAGEYCSCAGTCKPAPTNCPTECERVCICNLGPSCNGCLARRFGGDYKDQSYWSCSSDGGANGIYDAGAVGTGCIHTYNCQSGLKCCFSCDGGQDCGSFCTDVDGGECPPL